tara:strand:- start:612 stop:794 length:183 start_codon:yes stop_codon:yes gene_type:complete
MDRNLNILKDFPFNPVRFPRYKIGPGEVNFTDNAKIIKIGDNIIIPKIEKIISNNLLNIN